MKFYFRVVETNVGIIQLEAEDYETALEQADNAYFQGKTIWEDGGYEICFDKSEETKS